MKEKLPEMPTEKGIIVNALDPKTGQVLCPACNRGSTWREAGSLMTRGPMIRMKIPNRVNALVHMRGCQSLVMRKAFENDPALPPGTTIHSLHIKTKATE